MFNLGFWEREALLAWQGGRAPIVAALVALALFLTGRGLRSAALTASAGGLAMAAGWAASPEPAGLRLAPVAAVALGLGLALDLRGWWAGGCHFAFAVVAGWWLAGAPTSDAAAGQVLPQMASLALAVLLALRLLRAPASPWSAAAAALALAGGLAAAGAPPDWTALALAALPAGLAAVGAPMAGTPRQPLPMAAVRLPLASGFAAVAGLAALALGRLGRGGLSRLDLALLAPLAALWATPRLARRLRRHGWLAAPVAAVLAVALAWAAGRGLLAR